MHYKICVTWTNAFQNMCYMDQCITQYVLHEPMHYKICVTCHICVFNGYKIYPPFVMTQQCNPPISHFSRPCNEFQSVWSMLPCYITTLLQPDSHIKSEWTCTPIITSRLEFSLNNIRLASRYVISKA